MRRSANWNSVQPPITRTHWGGGVRRACSRSIAQGIGQRRHPVPAQFHVEVESAADHVDVGVVEAGDDPPPLQVDPLRLLIGGGKQFLPAGGRYPSAGYGNGRNLGTGRVEGGNSSVMQNQIGCVHLFTPL